MTREERSARILAVDDTLANLEAIEALLAPSGYDVAAVSSGAEALSAIARQQPDLVLLDVVMPGMDGLEVCRRIRADSRTHLLPIVMVTASAGQERVRALEAGADDFLAKPIDRAELLARVGSLVRIKRYHDTIQAQASELVEWNRSLEQRVKEQVSELERLGRLRRFLSPQLAELLISAEGESLLETHRRQIAALCCQLPGFRALAETTDPEEVVALLSDYHQALGAVVFEFEGSVGPLVGDRVTVFFNDPLPADDPAGQAIRLALALRARMHELASSWSRRGLAPDFGVGIDLGYATLGTMGFAGRQEYGAIGTVVHVASALSDQAHGGQILTTQRLVAALDDSVETTTVGDMLLPGFVRALAVFQVHRMRAAEQPAVLEPAVNCSSKADAYSPLSEREREVVSLIAKGCSNRQIAEELVIAEGTAVRHVANILNKLGFHSRAQVAVWAVQQARNPYTDRRALTS
jgi:adenylate cyclase